MRGCVIPPPLEHLTEFITRKAWKTRRSSTFHKNTVWKFTSITNGRTNQLLDQKYDGPDSVGSYLPHILRKLHISSVSRRWLFGCSTACFSAQIAQKLLLITFIKQHFGFGGIDIQSGILLLCLVFVNFDKKFYHSLGQSGRGEGSREKVRNNRQ